MPNPTSKPRPAPRVTIDPRTGLPNRRQFAAWLHWYWVNHVERRPVRS